MGRCCHKRAWKRVGKDKYNAYLQFKQLYGEYDFVFFGDDGQGDLLAAQWMAKASGSSGRLLWPEAPGKGTTYPALKAALIHEVLPNGTPLAMTPEQDRGDAWRENLSKQGILFHRTYVGAAVDLHQHDSRLVSLAEVAHVATA